MIYYDTMELADLLVRLKDKQKKDASGEYRGTMVYHLLSRCQCDWETLIEQNPVNELKNAIPNMFVEFEDVPLMLNNITDDEDEVILQWRLDLGK